MRTYSNKQAYMLMLGVPKGRRNREGKKEIPQVVTESFWMHKQNLCIQKLQSVPKVNANRSTHKQEKHLIRLKMSSVRLAVKFLTGAMLVRRMWNDILEIIKGSQVVVVYTFNPSTQAAEGGESL